MNNELFNKHKLSPQITSARAKYLKALVGSSDKIDWGFALDKFPPEKTIYYSLLRNTGLHVEGRFTDVPNNNVRAIWDACEEFLRSTVNKPRRVSELLKILSSQPYKLKQGFLDFWIPTYFYMKRQDYSLYNANTGGYIPEVDLEVLALFQKHHREDAREEQADDDEGRHDDEERAAERNADARKGCQESLQAIHKNSSF